MSKFKLFLTAAMYLVCEVAAADTTDIFVRLTANPFSPPHYLFSYSENGDPVTLELIRGNTYTFTRTDSSFDHPFNIGAGWRVADTGLEISSTGSGNRVGGVASIQRGQTLTVTIPSDFERNTITYFCFPHSTMVGTISVIAGAVDSDNDGVLDSNDAFPNDATESEDSDGDGVGNNADDFPNDASESLDSDSDGIGNNADMDDDGDGTNDASDAFPLDPNETVDTDSDGVGNNADSDDDGDGAQDGVDAFPLDASESVDTDSDGVGDNTDAFPLDASETLDTDSDGTGNNEDLDDDGDGFSDEQEAIDGTDPLSKFSCRSGCFSFDIDQSASLSALTDGLLVMRHLFDFSGDTLIANATDASSSRSGAGDITGYLTDGQDELDIDGSGDVEALTDGLLLIRYLFDFRGESLIKNAVDTNGTRTTAADIEAYIEARLP